MSHIRADWTGEAGGVTNTSPVTPDLIRGPASSLVRRGSKRDPRLRGGDEVEDTMV
jgi:hypothetical protein